MRIQRTFSGAAFSAIVSFRWSSAAGATRPDTDRRKTDGEKLEGVLHILAETGEAQVAVIS